MMERKISMRDQKNREDAWKPVFEKDDATSVLSRIFNGLTLLFLFGICLYLLLAKLGVFEMP